MKSLIAALLLLPFICNAQKGIIGGISAGYASNNHIVGSLGIGAKMDRYNATVNISAFAVNKRDVPSIFDLRLGCNLGGWEVFAGPAYHYAGESIVKDEKDKITGYAAYSTEPYKPNPANGFKTTFGIIKHFGVASVGFYQSGNISSLQIGLNKK